MLKLTAEILVEHGKGILCSDECPTALGARFAKLGIENTENNRKSYREMLFTAAGPLENYISGVILCHETLAQKTEGGKRLAALFEVGSSYINEISSY